MNKFTPGPWRVTEAWGNVDRTEIAFHEIRTDPRSAEPQILASTWAGPHQGNANVIAASPEMFEAIEFALNEIKDSECYCDGEHVDGRFVGQACYFHRIESSLRDALAKATGGENE